ncbi:MAG TPA: hypothetical protein PK228_16195, partial [Saprospiraceae bacterium]|nr:hypothetical protein [Saprospiraceae bacterium]
IPAGTDFRLTHWPMLQKGIIKTSVLLLVCCLSSCGTVSIYQEPDKPIFHSNLINSDTVQHGDFLKVVSFNIEKSEKIEEAITELTNFEKIKDIDIYLLQEMDEKGVDAIAKKLNLNYLYIPIVYNNLLKKNMGNAILTKGTIHYYEKLILPNSKWTNNRRRHATIGQVNIHDKEILVYSVHTETIVMSRKKRMEQVDSLIEHIKMKIPDYQYILTGGDFNALLSKDSKLVVKKFIDAGFDWSTSTAGSTGKAFFGLLKPTHDYIFSRGLKSMDAGKIEASRSSDHYPIYTELQY